MGRYPQGVRSFIPSYQAYQPDFTSIAKMLRIKQNQYDQNWKKLNNVYSSLYFAETTHDESQKVKDQLKNEIDFNLRRVSGLDLSLEQNVTAAQQVFQPFYENTSLMYDMAATKNINMAKSQAGGYKNAKDPELQKQYWADGVKAIDYRVQEFKETPYDQIASTGLASVGYTPYVDVGLTAEKLAKEFGDITTPPTLSEDGRYRVQTTNGPAVLMQPLEQLYQMRMANDPRIQAMYQTQAYVDRKDYMYQHAGEYGGDAQAAERAYLENEYKVLSGGVNKTNKKLKDNEEALNTQSQILQESLENGSAPAGAEEALNTVETNKQVVDSNLQLSNVEKDMVKTSSSNGTTSTGESNPFEDIDVLRNKVDFLRANAAMQKDFKQAAYIYSKRNMKTEYTEDKFALEAYKAKKAREIEYDKQLVESGVATWEVTADGPKAVPIKSRNNWSEEISGDQTVGEVNMKKMAEDEIRSEWEQFTPGVMAGIDIADSIKLDKAQGADKKINAALSNGSYKDKDGRAIDKNGNVLTLRSLKKHLQMAATPAIFKEETGMNVTDLKILNNTLLDLVSKDKTTSILLDSRYQTDAEKQKVINWKKQAIEDKILAEGIKANQSWVKDNTKRLLDQSSVQSGDIRNAQFLIDKNTGDVVSEKQYYDNVIKHLMNSGEDNWKTRWIKKYMADEARYIQEEARLDREGKRNRQAAWYTPTYWKGVGQGLSSATNWYKDWDDFLLPDNVMGEIITALRIADYDDVKEAWNKEWSNSRNFKEAPPFTYGTGAGVSSTGASTYVTPLAAHAKPTKEFYGLGPLQGQGIYDDYRKTKNLKTSIFSGIGTGKDVEDADKNTELHRKYAQAIWDAHEDIGAFEKGEAFKIILKPTTGLSGNKAAYTIIPSKEMLDEIVPKGGTDEEKSQYDQIRSDLKNNGATIIADRTQFDSYAFEQSTSNPIEADLKYQLSKSSGDVSKTYVVEPGYSMTFGLTKNKTYSIDTNFESFDLNTYLATGKLVQSSVPANMQSGQTLYTQFQNYQDSIIPITKAAVQERVSLVRYLKKNNPGITDKQIRQIFETYNFQYDLG